MDACIRTTGRVEEAIGPTTTTVPQTGASRISGGGPVGLSAQELLEIQRYLPQRLVHHLQLDHVVRGHPEAHGEHGQPDELVGDRPAVHAQVPEQQVRALVVAVHGVLGAVHVRPVVAEQRRGYAHQRVPQEAGGHQRFHQRFDGQPVAHAVDGQREHRRQQGRRQHGPGLCARARAVVINISSNGPASCCFSNCI